MPHPPPLTLGVPEGGPCAVGLSAAGPSSGVPTLHASFLWVPPMGMFGVGLRSLGVSGVGVSGLRGFCSALQVSALWVHSVGISDAASSYLGVP